MTPIAFPLLLLGFAAGIAGSRPAGRPTPRELAGLGAGLAIGLVGAVVVAGRGRLGQGLLLAAPVFALGALMGVVGAELLARPPDGAVRRAGLTPRRVRDHLPQTETGVAAVTLAVLLVLAAVTSLTASADDLGRAGRVLAVRCGPVGGAAGPYPGSFYTVPLAGALVAGLVIAGLALRVIVRRPGVADPDLDDATRRRASGRVVAATGLMAAVPLAGCALVTATTLRSFVGGPAVTLVCSPPWAGPLSWLLLAVAVAGTLVAGWFTGRLLRGAA